MATSDREVTHISIVHPSRLEAEAAALYLGTEARIRPNVETIARGGDWRACRGGVVIIGHDPERASLVPMMVRELTERGARVILQVADDADPVAQAGRFAGAYAVLREKGPLAPLLDVVDHALAGHARRQDTFGEAWQNSLTARGDDLTPRERDVVELMVSAEEPSIEEIGARLGMSPNTVRVHLANVRKRLGGERAKNRVSLRRALEEHGWVDPL
ncbi:response regulator transcription factor [Microbacteriaceae bacterium VKM Ac-2854]|nr:response regulator transcription factor [Microbacteriaceae bacterium VKM Ac-2854]